VAAGVETHRHATANGNRWLRLVLDDARSEGVPERFARAALWLPFAGLVLTMATYAWHPLFYFLLRDDKVYEWTQFALIVTVVALAATAARYRLSQRWWLAAAFLAVVTLGAFLLAGEEISWGQRVFGWTSESLEAVNRQGETNLHNISAEGIELESVFRAVMWTIGVFGVVAPFVVRRGPARTRAGELLRVITPPAFLAPCFLMIVGYRAMRFLLPDLTDATPIKKMQEFSELSLYAALAVMVGLLFLHARADRGRRVPDVRAGDSRPITRADLRPVVPLVVVVLVVTVVFAVMAAGSGISPSDV
jgi:hypothetical protein